MKKMTAKEVLNLMEWLKAKNFLNNNIVDCIKSIESNKKQPNNRAAQPPAILYPYYRRLCVCSFTCTFRSVFHCWGALAYNAITSI